MQYLSGLVVEGKLDTRPFTSFADSAENLGGMYEQLYNRKTPALSGVLKWH